MVELLIEQDVDVDASRYNIIHLFACFFFSPHTFIYPAMQLSLVLTITNLSSSLSSGFPGAIPTDIVISPLESLVRPVPLHSTSQ